MKNRSLLPVLPIVLVILLSGCGGDQPETSTSAAEAEPAPESAVVQTAAPETAQSMGSTTSGFASKVANDALSGKAADLASGMKEALRVSADRAVDRLAGPDGLIRSGSMGVPLPEAVEKLRKPLSAVGQEGLLNNFSDTLNKAAADSLKVAPDVLEETLSAMQLGDVSRLLQGGDTAFTDFLEKNSRTLITEKMMPLVAEATKASGAVKVYEQIKATLEQSGTGNLLSQVGAATGIELPGADFNLEQYVSGEALGRLFDIMAEEERKLRENPAARSTELLQSLFGTLSGS